MVSLRRQIQQTLLFHFSLIKVSSVVWSLQCYSVYRSIETTENKRADIIDFTVGICRKPTDVPCARLQLESWMLISPGGDVLFDLSLPLVDILK